MIFCVVLSVVPVMRSSKSLFGFVHVPVTSKASERRRFASGALNCAAIALRFSRKDSSTLKTASSFSFPSSFVEPVALITRGAASIAQGNAITGGINNLSNYYQNQQILNRLPTYTMS